MRWALLLSGLLALAAHAQAPVDEARDYGVAASAELRLDNVSAPTPREIPGAQVIATSQLRRLLQSPLEERPLLFDVLGGDGHPTLPGALWLPGAGRGTSFDDALQDQLGKLFEFVTSGKRSKAMVFFCTGTRCWLSYNAALRAARLGYTAVYWYRGGIEAWAASGGALVEPRVVWERPAS